MTDAPAPDTAHAFAAPASAPPPKPPRPRAARSHPLLAQLAQWHPRLFGGEPLPLKRGIYQDLLDAHPGQVEPEALKLALSIHTRQSRYLSAVAQGLPRHDLQGQPCEAMAPEHIYHALTELFRRRQQRSAEDLGPQLRRRIAQAWAASGMTRQAYAQAMRGRNPAANATLDAALDEAAAQSARDEALLRAFEASGQTEADFARAYGITNRQVTQTLARARRWRQLPV